MSADGGIKFGQYILLRRIARGGMAEVFLAQQRGLEGFDRRVAVKRILPHLTDTPDFIKMFLAEARLAAQLTHPNVVHIYDFGKVDSDYFIAMEFVDGVHAGQLFTQGEREPMPPTLVARVGADAAAALNYAHELRDPSGKPLGLVHRDVSPANIMVSYDGIVKLCDFGIAKAAAANSHLTNPGQVKGKYAYMSPEQTVAGALDGRSDVFSLGICLWELAVGKTIVPRGDAVEAMRLIRDGKLPSVSQVAPATPPPLAKAIGWALEPKREKRATATELAQALEAFIKSSPELATSMQLASWVRARFPRDASGPQPSQAGAQHPGTGIVGVIGTAAAPSTMASPGTAVAPATSVSMVSLPTPSIATPVRALIAASRLPGRDDEPDLETIAVEARLPDRSSDAVLVETDDPDAEPTLKPGKQPVFDPGQRPLNLPLPKPRASGRIAPEDKTHVATGPRAQPDMATVLASRPVDANATMLADDHSDHHETMIQSGALRQPMSNPSAIPTMAVAALPPYLEPVGPPLEHQTAPVRKRPPRAVVVGAALGGIMLLTFLIVVATRRTTPAASIPPADAAVVAISILPPDAPAPPDAPITSPITSSPIDAPAPPDAIEPTLALDAGTINALLEIDTRPEGALVTIGDQRRTSPAKFALPAGKHAIVAELPGWENEAREVELLAGEHLNKEIVFMNHTRVATTSRVPQTGKLTIRTTPYSEVFNGAKKIGEAPFADLVLPAGIYTLTFKNPTRPTTKKKVTIFAGKITKLSFTLPL
ncbi:MAG: protein kinase [Proteobacteria bacterium]|nr:protein kinase [Pseudomonadota bacterium]